MTGLGELASLGGLEYTRQAKTGVLRDTEKCWLCGEHYVVWRDGPTGNDHFVKNHGKGRRTATPSPKETPRGLLADNMYDECSWDSAPGERLETVDAIRMEWLRENINRENRYNDSIDGYVEGKYLEGDLWLRTAKVFVSHWWLFARLLKE